MIIIFLGVNFLSKKWSHKLETKSFFEKNLPAGGRTDSRLSDTLSPKKFYFIFNIIILTDNICKYQRKNVE